MDVAFKVCSHVYLMFCHFGRCMSGVWGGVGSGGSVRETRVAGGHAERVAG